MLSLHDLLCCCFKQCSDAINYHSAAGFQEFLDGSIGGLGGDYPGRHQTIHSSLRLDVSKSTVIGSNVIEAASEAKSHELCC
jgi:hypothetical protein